jgi:pyruvate dehydrogenase E2 component (dihydrolipoamide acetyltransferase)
LAREHGVDLGEVAGSGPNGRVVRADVLNAKAAPAARGNNNDAPAKSAKSTAPGFVWSPPVPTEDTLTPASQMRKTIARRLTEAKRDVPHIYLTSEASVDHLFTMREQLNSVGGVKISVNDLVVKAMALALRRVPQANCSWTDQGILQHGHVDVGVAVTLAEGLITPVVRDADLKSVGSVSLEIKSLAERARAKKLRPEEFSGGSATVSNLGMFGVREFQAIVNPPESVILAVGATEKRPIVVEGADGEADKVVISRRMLLSLSCDHRVVDGVLGAQLLAEVVKLLEHPMAMAL